MFWDKKESAKSLPDLPPSKTPAMMYPAEEDDSDDSSEARHGLPSFPDSPIQKGFSQAAIKDAVSNESVGEQDTETVSSPTHEEAFKTVEVEEWSPQQQNMPSISNASSMIPSMPPMMSRSMARAPKSQSLAPPPAMSVTPFPPSSLSTPPRNAPTGKNADIFVKIDKFYSAKRALEAAASKIDDIDALLQKIRETKMREEQELTSWEKEITTIKARIKDVTDTIFEKVE